MVTFTAIVVSHANPDGLRRTLGQLRYQTRPPDETLVFCADTPDLARFREEFDDVEFLERPRRNDWGHEDRAEGLDRATGRWTGWFNDDDKHDRTYLERMLGATDPDVDAVYCNWNEFTDCEFRLGSSTAANFIVRTSLARTVGWTSRRYEADGDFIDAFANAAQGRVAKVTDLLYTHNAFPRRGSTYL